MTAIDDDSEPETAHGILSANEIDLEWINRRVAPLGSGEAITAIHASTIGTGQVGENVRCQLEWAVPATSDNVQRPDSVVLKLPSIDATSRQTAAATRSYIKEIGFYRDIAGAIGFCVPDVYFIDEDIPNNSFVLVMEDISPADQGEQLLGSSTDQAELAVAAAAHLHRSTSNADWIGDLDWMDTKDHASRDQRAELISALYPGFVSRYGHHLSSAEQTTCEWFHNNIESYFAHTANPAIEALTHGDYRLDNMLFGQDGAPSLTVVDWQTVSIGSPLIDVSYFIGTSVKPTQQRELIDPLLDLYEKTLKSSSDSKVTSSDTSPSRSWIENQFGLYAPSGLAMAIVASQIVGQTERGDAMFLVMAKGSCNLMDLTATADLVR